MEQKFKVIYLGHLQDDADVQLIAHRFADKFKISQEKATKVLQAGKEVVLHPGAEHVKAYKLKAALESLGLQMRLERIQITSSNPTPNPAEIPKEKTTDVQENQSQAPIEKEAAFKQPAPLSIEPMSIEPMEEETADDEPEKVETKESKPEAPTVASNVNTPDWDLEPIKEENSDSEESEETENESISAVTKQDYVDLSKPSMVYKKKSEEADEAESLEKDENTKVEKEDKEPSFILSFIKQFGGIIAAGLVGVLFLAKKFGLLKFLKIGGLMAAAAYAGYNPEEACMGNGACEDAISDQIDACWSYSELENHDWDNLSDEQYFELKPQVEEKFIACFRYEDSGERVLESPIELRFDLIDMCNNLSSPVSGCEAIAEKQIKVCYERSEILEPIKASGYDYYGSMFTDMEYFKNFYGCFEDNSGNMLFAEYVDEMDPDAMNDMLQQLQEELDAQ